MVDNMEVWVVIVVQDAVKTSINLGEVAIGWTVLVLDHFATLVMKTKDH